MFKILFVVGIMFLVMFTCEHNGNPPEIFCNTTNNEVNKFDPNNEHPTEKQCSSYILLSKWCANDKKAIPTIEKYIKIRSYCNDTLKCPDQITSLVEKASVNCTAYLTLNGICPSLLAFELDDKRISWHKTCNTTSITNENNNGTDNNGTDINGTDVDGADNEGPEGYESTTVNAAMNLVISKLYLIHYTFNAFAITVFSHL